MNTPPVSLLGLGRMGEPIARRLLAALGSLTVWNRTTAKASALGAAGPRVARSPAEAAAPITLTVLTDLADVEAVLTGDDGLIAGWAAAGVERPVLVVHGTVSPVGVAALAERLADDGIGVVDAPLSGGVAGAESGALSVMVGGSDDVVGRVWPVLSLIGSTVAHLGPSGSGEIAKSCNQVVVAATVTALSEALVLADAGGIERTQLLELLGGGLADSEVLRQKRDRVAQRRLPRRGQQQQPAQGPALRRRDRVGTRPDPAPRHDPAKRVRARGRRRRRRPRPRGHRVVPHPTRIRSAVTNPCSTSTSSTPTTTSATSAQPLIPGWKGRGSSVTTATTSPSDATT
jgi:3-hydroxyisobutyrate dehydrogenase-like beta-hydroxyacid dehydrogenase